MNHPIIDTHQHLWDLDLFDLPWLPRAPAINRSHRMDDYVVAAAGYPIAQTVYMEVDLRIDQQLEEAEYASDLCADSNNLMSGCVVSGRPADPAFAEHLDSLNKLPGIRGIRQVLHGDETPPGFCLRPEFVYGVRQIGAQGWSFDICIRPDELPDAAQLISLCTETRFILDHCGNPDVKIAPTDCWKEGIKAVATLANVDCKISGIVASAVPGQWSASTLAPFVEWCAECFGPERLVFGGDWPVCTLTAPLSAWIDALAEITEGWSNSDQAALWHGNAIRVYRLPEIGPTSGTSRTQSA